MAQRTGALEAPAVEAQRKSASLWGDAFRRLLKNRLAVVGAIVVFILLIVAIVGPYLTPFEYQAQDYAAVAKYARPGAAVRLEPHPRHRPARA